MMHPFLASYRMFVLPLCIMHTCIWYPLLLECMILYPISILFMNASVRAAWMKLTVVFDVSLKAIVKRYIQQLEIDLNGSWPK